MFAMPATIPISKTAFETAVGFWFEILARATLQSLVVLAVISLFWLVMRRHVSHAFAHGLFLLVPARFAAIFMCCLLAFEMPMEIPLPFISPPVTEITRTDAPPDEHIISAPIALPEPSIPPVDSELVTEFATLPAGSEHFETAGSQPAETSEALQVESISRPGFEWPSPSVILFGAWFGICSILAVRFLIASLVMDFRLKRTGLRSSPGLSAIVMDVASEIGLRRCPRVVTTTTVHSPAVFGLIRPKLLIPAGFETDFDEAEMRWAIAHELAHLKRRDLWSVAFERAVGLAGFFHPALWLARRATANFRELACDDFAGNVTGLPPRKCAETFLKILVWADRQPVHAPDSPLVLGINPRYPAIRRRIENMTEQENSKPIIPRWLWCASPFLVAFVLLPISPRFVAAEVSSASIAEASTNDQNAKRPFEFQAIDAETGHPVAGAVVHFQTDRKDGKITTDANGKALIPFEPGKDDFISIRISSDIHVPLRLRRSSIEDPDFPPVSPFVAKLTPGMPIGGLVHDKGEPVKDARVLVTFQAKPNENGTRSYRCELVRTGADGRWKTSQVDPKATQIDVAALHPEFAIDWAGTEADPRGRVEPPFETLKSATHQIQLKRGQTLTGRVIDLDGKPVAGAEVRSDEWPVEFGEASQLTDAKGEFRIGNLGTVQAPVKIAVHKPGQGWCIKSIDVQDQDRVATFQLIPGRPVTGRVTDAEGKPLADVRVDDTTLPRWLRAPDAIRRTDADGRFEIADLPADFVSLIFSKTGYLGYEAKIDTVRTSNLDVVLKNQSVVEGRVTDAATGQPVADYQLIYRERLADGERSLSIHGRHVEGRFRFPASPFHSRDGSVHEFRLRIEAPGYEPITTDLMKVDDPHLSLNFALKRIDPADSKSIEGRVLKPDGTPAAGAAVAFYTPKDGSWPRYEPQFENGRLTSMTRGSLESPPAKIELVRTDTEGKFRIPADAVKIGWIVTHESGVFRSPEARHMTAAEPMTIRLGPYGRVQGVFLRDGKPQANVRVWYSGPGINNEMLIPIRNNVLTDDRGRFEIERVIPGMMRLAFPHKDMKSLWQFLAEPFEVPAGASLNVDTSVTEFGHHQLVSDAAGKEVAKSGSGEFGKEFLVYGRATDAATGKPLTKTRALFITGQPGDDPTIWVQWVGPHDGTFTAYHAVSNRSVQETQKIDPYLIVFAPGYEPFVSPRPIPRGDGPVRMDVALKPAMLGEPKETRGQILRADGTAAKRADIAFSLKTPVSKAGQSSVRWQVLTQPGSGDIDGPSPVQADEEGRFRISSREAIDQLTVLDSTGCAVVTGDELAQTQGVIRLGPWARVEGKVEMKLPAEGDVRGQVNYRSLAWSPFMNPPAAGIRPDGTFAIENVLPGKHSLSLMIHKQIDHSSTSYSQLDPPVGPVSFETVAGQTTKLTIGAKPAEPEKPRDPKAASKPRATDSKPAITAEDSKPAAPPKPEFPAPSGKFITGKVLKPDGSPAAGADVGFFTTTDDRNDRYLPRLTRNGRIEAIEHRAIVRGQWKNSEREPIRTDAEGRFRLPVWAEKFGWCVTHDSGVLRSTKLVEMAEGETELKLEPWGRIEGTLLLDERPMAGARLVSQPNFDIGKNRFGNPMPTSIRTNHPGMFVIERAMPGPYRFAFPNPASANDQTQYSDHDLNVPAGGTLKFEVNQTMFGWEERLKDDSGKIVDRKTYGAMRPGFRVYGQVIDADTGVPVEPMSAWLLSGAKDDRLEIVADERPGSVFELDSIMTPKGPRQLSEIDPYLVVVAPGYEPYVSAERIKKGDSPVRHDVRLKKLPPEKTLTIEGQVLDPDGNPARVAFYRNRVPGETAKVGETTFDWKFDTQNPPFTDDQGRFRFKARNAAGKLVFSNQVGFTQMEAADFAKLPGGGVRLGPWGKVRLRVMRNGNPDGNFRFSWGHRESWKLSFVPSESWYPQEDGTFLLDRLPPMPVELCVMGKTEKGSKYVLKTVSVEAKSGETTDLDVVVSDEELKEAEAFLKARQAGN
ncbi:hypothetical protein GC170_21125 [bacterium]|nr:hypothetical protein [bacterium]